MNGQTKRSIFIPKKYRQIVLAVAAFLFFDLGVLILNFYTSFQISADAVSINLAGRERMLSQKMTKALLALQVDNLNQQKNISSLEELKATVNLFNTTFDAFKQGGMAQGSNNKAVRLDAITSPVGLEILQKADAVWRPYLDVINDVLTTDAKDPAKLDKAIRYGRENNLKLLGLMNDFTTHLQQAATAKAGRLRLIQTIGIALALMNFGVILFHFLRQLRENDLKIEAAQQETEEILSTVKEGLFLLGSDFHIGTQVSASLPSILGRKAQPGASLFDVLEGQISGEILAATRDYIELLFGDRVIENLMQDLNPLMQVEMQVINERGLIDVRHISVHFNRVRVQGKISHLLVTVQDVSELLRLQSDLDTAAARTHGEIEALLKLLSVDRTSLLEYLTVAKSTLVSINEQIEKNREAAQGHKQLINGIFRRIHQIKGDAAMLGLDVFEQQAQEFEDLLHRLREQPAISGNDLVAIPLKLDAFIERILTIQELTRRFDSGLHTKTDQPNSIAGRFAMLARRIANEQGKSVNLQIDLTALETLAQKPRTTATAIALQLLRNAVAHGIEKPDERILRAKQQTGEIIVQLAQIGNSEYELKVRDDGMGLSPQIIRDKLIRSGRYTPEQVAQWDSNQIVMKIFEPGFSTQGTADAHAGQGVGLDVVKEQISSLGGHLRIRSTPKLFTEFLIRFTV